MLKREWLPAIRYSRLTAPSPDPCYDTMATRLAFDISPMVSCHVDIRPR